MGGETGETAEMEASGAEEEGETWGAARPVLRSHRLRGGVASAPHVGLDARDWLTLAFCSPSQAPRPASPVCSLLSSPACAELGGARAGLGGARAG